MSEERRANEREATAGRMRAARAALAETRREHGATAAQRASLFWSSSAAALSPADSGHTPPSSQGYESYRNIVKDSLPYGCALCGEKRVRGGNEIDLCDEENPTPTLRDQAPLSERGFLHRGELYDVIAALVDTSAGSPCYWACDPCSKALSKHQRPTRWSTDWGALPENLPELYPVERCAIAAARFYGCVLKISCFGDGGSPTHFSGHTILFPTNAATELATVLPNTDIDAMISVHFIGPQAKWSDRTDRLNIVGNSLAFRADVVYRWLRFLKDDAKHPAYQAAVFKDEAAAANEISSSVTTLLP
jgi:hypothetical protein